MNLSVFNDGIAEARAKLEDVKWITPFNVVTAVILALWVPLVIYRFVAGCGAVTNASDTNPWGVFIGFNVCCGVALSAGGFCVGSATYLFGMKDYHHIVRQAVFTGFLGYSSVPIALLLDLGQPWRLPYPYIISWGFTSVMFLVAWHVSFYLTCQFVEFTPAIFEFLNWKRWRHWALKIVVGATIFGGILTTLHQSALGALFLLAPSKVHPLWYSSYIPIFFLVSALAGGIGVVIVVDAIGRTFMPHLFDPEMKPVHDRVVVGLGRAVSVVLFIYLGFKISGIAVHDTWSYLGTGYGAWFIFEMVAFVAIPSFLFAVGARDGNVRLIRWMGVLTVLGVILNRMNTAFITFNWQLPWDQKYIPGWMEIFLALGVVTLFAVVFKWSVTFLPVFKDHPKFKEAH